MNARRFSIVTAPAGPVEPVSQESSSSLSSSAWVFDAVRGLSRLPVNLGTSAGAGCRRRSFVVGKSFSKALGTPLVTFQSDATRLVTAGGRPDVPGSTSIKCHGTGGGGGVVRTGPGENLAGTMIQRMGVEARIGFVWAARAERNWGVVVEEVRVRRWRVQRGMVGWIDLDSLLDCGQLS